MTIKSDIPNEMTNNVLHSTESAIKALSQLEENLVRGRFKEGVAPYELMCKTLMGQKLWSSNVKDLRVDRNFNKVASIAERIINILGPYVDNLKLLTSVNDQAYIEELDHEPQDKLEKKTDQEKLRDDQLILNIILDQSKNKISYTKLRTELGWDRKRMEKVLDQMKGNGLIQVVLESSRKMISLN